MKATVLNGKRLLSVGNEPILEDAVTYEYLPGWKCLFKKLGGSFIQKFENLKTKSGITFYLGVRQVRKTPDSELN